MPNLPRVLSITSSSSSSPLGIAVSTLELHTSWLCRSFPRIYISHHCECTLKVDGYLSYAVDYIHQIDREASYCLCQPRPSSQSCYTSFTSEEFVTFMKGNGILHIKSILYHPSTNWLAERAVQTFKQGVTKIAGITMQERILIESLLIQSLVFQHKSYSKAVVFAVNLIPGTQIYLRVSNRNRRRLTTLLYQSVHFPKRYGFCWEFYRSIF